MTLLAVLPRLRTRILKGLNATLTVEIIFIDDESEPSKAPENASRLVNRDKVDALVGTVHSGVALAMLKVAKDSNSLLVIPNAGADAATGPLCGPNIFRTSFSNWQPAYAMGVLTAEQGKKRAFCAAWKYAAGDESLNGFKEGFEKGGGKVEKTLSIPFPSVEFQAILTEIAAAKPDVVYIFFAGAAGAKFVKEYAASGLAKETKLVAPGFVTDGNLDAIGEAYPGLETTLHYADGLAIDVDKVFRKAYFDQYKVQPDVFAVQGYDTFRLLQEGFGATKGDTSARAEIIKAMESAVIDSPRGTFTLSRAHNPVQDIYLRKVEQGQNKFVSVAVRKLEDPARGCKMST
jgi:branched-chain amino acid transport system substrate-binding protein